MYFQYAECLHFKTANQYNNNYKEARFTVWLFVVSFLTSQYQYVTNLSGCNLQHNIKLFSMCYIFSLVNDRIESRHCAFAWSFHIVLKLSQIWFVSELAWGASKYQKLKSCDIKP